MAQGETTIPDFVRPLIAALVRDLAAGNYSDVERDGRAGHLTAEDLRRLIADYGATLIPLPDNGFEVGGDAHLIEGSDPPEWAIDQDLWTEEQGRSDLTLQMDVKLADGEYRLEVTDLHVL